MKAHQLALPAAPEAAPRPPAELTEGQRDEIDCLRWGMSPGAIVARYSEPLRDLVRAELEKPHPAAKELARYAKIMAERAKRGA